MVLDTQRLIEVAALSGLNLGVVLAVFVGLYGLVRVLHLVLALRRGTPAPGPEARVAGLDRAPSDQTLAIISAAIASAVGHDEFRVVSIQAAPASAWATAGREQSMHGLTKRSRP